MDTKDKLNYASYLKIDQLLSIQTFQSPDEHDEMLFIIIHQTYELWFKQIIHELKALRDGFNKAQTHKILSGIRRVRHILKILVSQVDVLETMTADSFRKFREYLGTSSGFQSYQFRLLEFMLGIKKESAMKIFVEDSKEYKTLYNAYISDSIWDYFINFLKKENPPIVSEKISNNSEMSNEQKLLLSIYINKSIYTEIAEALMDVDEGLQEWRYRHVKLVERTIGQGITGTGGSSGFEFLKNTLFKSFCPELWKIRDYL
jgi:tryptophan 2,3-dioxygenase